MAGPTRGNLPPSEQLSQGTLQRNSRIGLILFAVYLVVYAAYVLVNALRPNWMGYEAFAGLNWAVVSGMGLIIGAFIIALIYTYICRRPPGGQA